MNKIINPMYVEENWNGSPITANVYIKINLKNGRLSISGVIGPLRNGDAIGSCGQINMSFDEYYPEKDRTYSEGWNKETFYKFLSIWDKWHLNDMRAGDQEQTKAIEEWKSRGNKYEYNAVCEYLKSIGLYEHNGYKYGTSWLKEEIPSDVIEFLSKLPETIKQPAWV